MGSGKRTQPKRLKDKLKAIRLKLDVTQERMADLLKARAPGEYLHASYISQFERGLREPSLIVLLAYARLARISTDVLIDDKLELPKRLPAR
jgi:transcriptional regulator with XRE-family HTH domain